MRRLCVGLAAALAIAAPATARAEWSPPQQVSPVQPQLETPRLAFDGEGHVFAAWDESAHRNLYASVGSGRPQLLGDDVVLDDLTASRNGRVLVVATGRGGRGGRIETFVRRPGGRFRASQVLDRIPRPYAYFHHALLGSDPAGDAVVVWTRARRRHPDSPLFIAVRHRGGHFGRARAISKTGVGAFTLAMNPSGQFVVAWARKVAVESRVGRGNKLGPVRRVGIVNTAVPEVVTAAIDDAGDSLLAWLGTTNVELAYRKTGFGFETPRGLPHDQTGGFGGHMGLAFTSNEHALLALDGSNSQGAGIFAFDIFQGVPSSAVSLSSPTPSPGLGPRLQGVAAGPRGQSVVTWAALRASAGYTGPSDLVASYRDGGGFSPPEQVSAADAPLADTSGFPVATVRFDPVSGNPVALWVADRIETSTRR